MRLVYSDLFNKSWDSAKDDLPILAGLSLVYAVGIGAIGIIPYFGGLFSSPFTAGFLVCLLKIRQKKEIGYEDVFWGFLNFNRFLQLLIAGFLVSLISVAGMICLVIPGIWFIVASSLTTVYLVLNDTDAVTAMKASLAAVKGHWWSMLGLLLLIGILFLMGTLCFLVGLLVVAPLAGFMMIHAAEALSKQEPLKHQGPPLSGGPSVLTVNP